MPTYYVEDYRVILEDHVLEDLAQRALHLDVETGGHLVAIIEDEGSTARIIGDIPAPPDSTFGKHSMQMGREGVQEKLQALWETNVYWCGTWHSHPPQNGGTPEPSGIDLATLRGDEPAWPEPFLLIVSGNEHSLWHFTQGKKIRLEPTP